LPELDTRLLKPCKIAARLPKSFVRRSRIVCDVSDQKRSSPWLEHVWILIDISVDYVRRKRGFDAETS
jgi:hypothetical protein